MDPKGTARTIRLWGARHIGDGGSVALCLADGTELADWTADDCDPLTQWAPDVVEALEQHVSDTQRSTEARLIWSRPNGSESSMILRRPYVPDAPGIAPTVAADPRDRIIEQLLADNRAFRDTLLRSIGTVMGGTQAILRAEQRRARDAVEARADAEDQAASLLELVRELRGDNASDGGDRIATMLAGLLAQPTPRAATPDGARRAPQRAVQSAEEPKPPHAGER